jgi:hypothetical protein
MGNATFRQTSEVICPSGRASEQKSGCLPHTQGLFQSSSACLTKDAAKLLLIAFLNV